jgi:hypothetical protein
MTLRAQDAAQKPVLNTAYLQYIEQYKKIAIEQEKTHKIPACITLAQGLLESGAGMSELATKANNHFGIKCHKDWTGETYSHDDETAAECFRKYRRAKDSYEDHSLFLMRPRYASLFELPISDYKGWAHGLRRCGYATDPTYAAKLIKLIEDYGLTSLETAELPKEQVAPTTKQPVVEESEQTLDNVITQTLGKDKKVSATMGELSHFTEHEVYSEKMVRWVIAELGDTYETIGYEFNIEVSRLRRYNNAEGRKQPEIGDKVYLTRHK